MVRRIKDNAYLRTDSSYRYGRPASPRNNDHQNCLDKDWNRIYLVVGCPHHT